MPQSKWRVSLPNSRPLKRRWDSNIEPLVLINIIVVVAIVIVIVVVLMGEFAGDCSAPVVSGLILAASILFHPSFVFFIPLFSFPPSSLCFYFRRFSFSFLFTRTLLRSHFLLRLPDYSCSSFMREIMNARYVAVVFDALRSCYRSHHKAPDIRNTSELVEKMCI